MLEGMASPESTAPATVRLAPIEGLRQYLVAVRGFSRNARLFLVITGFRGLTIYSLQTVLNLYLYSRGYDTRIIGAINAAQSLATLLVSVPIGFVTDRVGRRAILVAGGITYPLALLAVSLAASTPMLLLTMFLFGAAATAYWVAGVPLLFASTVEEERVQAFSINSFLLYGIGPVGAFASGLVVEAVALVFHVSASSAAALRYGMWFMVLTAALGASPLLWLREPPAASRHESSQVQSSSGIPWLFLRLLLPDLILAFGAGAIITFVQLYFHLRFRLDPGPVGLVVGSGGVAAGVAALITPTVARRWGHLRATVRSQAATVPLMIVLALSMQLWLAIPAYWLMLMLRGMADPVYTTFVQEQVPDAYRARLTGFYSVTYAIGFSLGPAAAGQLQMIGGFTPAFTLGALCYGAGALLLYLFFGRPRSR